MAITAADWKLLMNSMIALDTRLEQAGIDGPSWELPTPQPTGMSAREYLQRVYERLQKVKKAVEKARESTIKRVKDAADEVSGIAGGIAEHAAKVAEDVAEDLSDGFKSIAGYFEESAKTVATLTLGTVVGLGIVLWMLLSNKR
jgi:vacuolar-type H+-ATPase subunit H